MIFRKKPTIFHITHWKSGSQWVYVVLRDLYPDRVVAPSAKTAHVQQEKIVEGKIYPTVYLQTNEFDQVEKPKNHKTFFVMRDLRDTLVSYYFSMVYSHPLESATGKHEFVAKSREQLSQYDVAEGLLKVIAMQRTADIYQIQKDWYTRAPLVLRYEEMIQDETNAFQQIVDFIGQKVDRDHFENVIYHNSFQNVSGGRKPGEEDIQSHFRKGISGDWKNYFTDEIKDAFKERYGDILITTGYETDNDW